MGWYYGVGGRYVPVMDGWMDGWRNGVLGHVMVYSEPVRSCFIFTSKGVRQSCESVSALLLLYLGMYLPVGTFRGCNLYKLGRRRFFSSSFCHSLASLWFIIHRYIHVGTIVPTQTQLTSNMALPSCLRKSSFSTSWVSSTSPHCSV